MTPSTEPSPIRRRVMRVERKWRTDPAAVPMVDEVCDWLNACPELGEVARETRRLRLLLRDLETVVQLLRQHVLLEIGEGISTAVDREEPF